MNERPGSPHQLGPQRQAHRDHRPGPGRHRGGHGPAQDRLFGEGERHTALRPLGGAILLNATGIVILRSLGVQVDDNFASRSSNGPRVD